MKSLKCKEGGRGSDDRGGGGKLYFVTIYKTEWSTSGRGYWRWGAHKKQRA